MRLNALEELMEHHQGARASFLLSKYGAALQCAESDCGGLFSPKGGIGLSKGCPRCKSREELKVKNESELRALGGVLINLPEKPEEEVGFPEGVPIWAQ